MEWFEPGTLPPVGEVPDKMVAQVIRPDRYGEPEKAFRREVVDVPSVGEDEVLVAVMAAGVNYNNVFAALASPLDVIRYRNRKGEPEEFHIGGSDGAGIVYDVGSRVKSVKVGDEVVMQAGVMRGENLGDNPEGDPLRNSDFRTWGYETNWGSFAQFALVKESQCLPRPRHLTWEESAVYMVSGATAYRMLHHWSPHTVREGDAVLIWGGSGGLGTMAIQLVRMAGGTPVAVVGSGEKASFCESLGARTLVRSDYHHWGPQPAQGGEEEVRWQKSVREFQKDLLERTEGRSPALVLEHPGAATLPTSLYVADRGGMVVTCGATTGYGGSLDIRYLWVFQKRLQGSHFASWEECAALNGLVEAGRVRPVLSRTFSFDETALSHQMLYENRHPPGSMAILVGASQPGTGREQALRS